MPYRSPDDTNDMSKYLPSDITEYVLNSFTPKPPPFHITFDEVSPSPEHLDEEQMTGHQLVAVTGMSWSYSKNTGSDCLAYSGSGN